MGKDDDFSGDAQARTARSLLAFSYSLVPPGGWWKVAAVVYLAHLAPTVLEVHSVPCRLCSRSKKQLCPVGGQHGPAALYDR